MQVLILQLCLVFGVPVIVWLLVAFYARREKIWRRNLKALNQQLDEAKARLNGNIEYLEELLNIHNISYWSSYQGKMIHSIPTAHKNQPDDTTQHKPGLHPDGAY